MKCSSDQSPDLYYLKIFSHTENLITKKLCIQGAIDAKTNVYKPESRPKKDVE